jgi:hypothetical protein
MSFEFLDPSGGAKAELYAVAPRLRDLKGLRLGLLDNSKTNAEKYLKMVSDILVNRYGVGEVKLYRKEALSKPAPGAILDDLAAHNDFAITGIGDCGSCSTNSVHDGIEIEKRGIPAVAICTAAFLPGLDALTKMRGMPEYRFAVVPHPLGVLFDDELQQRAELAAPQVVAIVSAERGSPTSQSVVAA